ncbi:MAG TPA: MlaA family lipoprotein [Steroidobacteraceae bacterium]|nr:MlaA family lipoprotein [Steroidobacteraceae bacterium]
MKFLVLLLAGLTLTGCATLPSGKPDPRDPWERMNRSTHAFNDAIDRGVGKPVAKAYVKVVPRFVRTGISNVFDNLDTLTTIVNDMLQGKVKQAGNDSARFLINTTFGVGGLYDAASAAGLDHNDEDFGQTFGKWGMKPGPYLVLPFLGPSTTRDTFGRLVDQFTYPVTYLGDESTRYMIRAVNLVDLRAGLLDLDEQVDRSYDRYAFIRNAWLQRREFQVKDGNIDDPSLDLEQDMEQDIEEEPATDAAPAVDPPAESAPAEADSPELEPGAAPPESQPPPAAGEQPPVDSGESGHPPVAPARSAETPPRS